MPRTWTLMQPNGHGEPVRVRRIRFEREREQVTLLARTLGWFDFSDPSSRVFRAQPPENHHPRGDWVATSRNRVTLPDFTDLGDGAWKLLRWFNRRPTTDPIARAFYALLYRGDHSPALLFDTSRESYEVARMITECALGVLVPAEKRGWL